MDDVMNYQEFCEYVERNCADDCELKSEFEVYRDACGECNELAPGFEKWVNPWNEEQIWNKFTDLDFDEMADMAERLTGHLDITKNGDYDYTVIDTDTEEKSEVCDMVEFLGDYQEEITELIMEDMETLEDLSR